MINLSGYIVLSPWVSKIFQIRKMQRFVFIFSPKIENGFIIDLYSFIIGLKDVRNVILNIIDNHDQTSSMHRSPPSSRQNFPDSKNAKICQIF